MRPSLYPNVERPGAFNQALTGFLATLPLVPPTADPYRARRRARYAFVATGIVAM
jgi:hypothetical protein